ncbi:hypothetical protein ACIGO9_29945 [Nocardia asteroides]|uniref:hypothetical protein n=1 Tax=Nocardia asteroides TaxID=1824 RepID=UPI0037C51F58
MTTPPDIHSLGFLVKLATRELRDAAEVLGQDPDAAESVTRAEAAALAEQIYQLTALVPELQAHFGQDFDGARQQRSSRKRQQGINWDSALLDYASETVARLKRSHPTEPGTASLAALVDVAVRDKLTEFEVRYNHGRRFPPLV